jgi:hypothetical protein
LQTSTPTRCAIPAASPLRTKDTICDVPFYQALSALTGPGKTPILADAVVQMRTSAPLEPIVLGVLDALPT